MRVSPATLHFLHESSVASLGNFKHFLKFPSETIHAWRCLLKCDIDYSHDRD